MARRAHGRRPPLPFGQLQQDTNIHPRIAELIDHLTRTRAALHRTVEQVPSHHREVAPPAGGWTVAEVLDHLALIERRVAGLVTRAVGAARDAGLGTESDDTPQLARLGGERVLDRTTKLKAPDIGLPTPGVRFGDALVALEASRAALLDAVTSVDGAALGAVKYPHPAMGELSMYQWIAFLGFHEGRHALQIEEIAHGLANRPASS